MAASALFKPNFNLCE